MSAVTTQTQQVLACIMVAVLCILGAMFSLDQLCTFKPKTTRDWCCAVAIVVLFVVVFAYLCDRSVKCVHRRREPFADYDTHEYSWGAAPNKSIEYADADNAAAAAQAQALASNAQAQRTSLAFAMKVSQSQAPATASDWDLPGLRSRYCCYLC